MRRYIARPNTPLVITCLLTIGIGIGWLMGLSLSPVVSIVITSITGSTAAIVAALCGLEKDTSDPGNTNKTQILTTRWSVNPLPLAVLMVGVLIGSTIGVIARNQSWLGSDISSEVTKWSQAGLIATGWTKEKIANRLFESRYISNTVATPSQNSNLGTFLFATETEECKRLLAAVQIPNGDVLKNELKSSTNRQLWQLPVVISDTIILKNVVEQVLCADGR